MCGGRGGREGGGCMCKGHICVHVNNSHPVCVYMVEGGGVCVDECVCVLIGWLVVLRCVVECVVRWVCVFTSASVWCCVCL